MTFAFIIDSVNFSKAVIAGETSLGGSESSCLGLARALAPRHDVHIFTTKLDEDAAGRDHAGVTWHDLREFQTMNQFIEWDVCIALRAYAFFGQIPIYARMRILWNQDLLVPGDMQNGVMGVAWALDHIAYVSNYHRAQWEDLQKDLAPIGWVTRNGFDPVDLPANPKPKDPYRIIHVSRPERGLGPLLAMWPALKVRVPRATLQICRYSSMYDTGPGSWSSVCESFDAQAQQVNAEVGGLEYLGELTKPQLYAAISEAAVMWYPGVASFAETSCIAAIEAQACGTPFVGSLRGALPETAPVSLLIDGDAEREAAYQETSINAVAGMLNSCANQTWGYRESQKDGREHVKRYTYAVLAKEWEAQIVAWFAERYEANKLGVLRQLLHEDDHTAAKLVADDIGVNAADGVDVVEALKAFEFCNYVIAGKDQDAEQYGNAAIQDPLLEVEFNTRFKAVIPHFAGCKNVLDVACGNGSFAIALAKADPAVHVFGLDYAESNIVRAKDAAQRAGVAGRCTFLQCIVFDFDKQSIHSDFVSWAALMMSTSHGEDDDAVEPLCAFDGMFVGEFVEHVGNCTGLIDALETGLNDGAKVVYTCPHGACAELVPRGMPLRRGHVHRFHHDDIKTVWGQKQDCRADYLASGVTERGYPIGNWLISYVKQAGKKAAQRPYAERIQRTRPKQTITVGLIVKDAENDLGRCLASIYKQADEILIGDTGSTDTTKAIAASYGATVIDLAPLNQQPEGFAGARNQVLEKATGDWFLWIDADETLLNAPYLRRYLDGTVFNGFVLRQTHLYIDGPPTWDIPVRLFRNTGRVKFYGCIHEQPQDGDCNTDIYPTLDAGDIKIAHTGYLTQEGREQKRVERNLPLLILDQQVFPNRILGKVLCVREAVIQADVHMAQYGGRLSLRARQGYAFAIDMFIRYFDDPAHKYHRLARPWYEAALRHLGMGWEQEIAIAGKAGGMGSSRAGTERVWVRDADEFTRVMAFKVDGLAKGMRPVTFHTEPFELERAKPTVDDEPEVVTSFEHLAIAEARSDMVSA